MKTPIEAPRIRLLGFDTSSKVGSLVAVEWEPGIKAGFESVRLVSEWTLNVDASFHSEKLLWAVHQTLESCGWKLDAVDAFAVGVGPGSFTGLRIGVTTARTLADTLNKPVIPLSSLAALARPIAIQASQIGQKLLVAAVTDASKGEVFSLYGLAKPVSECVCFAEGDMPGVWKRGVEERVLEPEELNEKLKAKLASDKALKWMLIGEGRHRYPEVSKGLPKGREWVSKPLFPDFIQGRYLGMLGWEAFQSGVLRPPFSVHPRYLRASDAEVKLKAGLLPPGPSRGGNA